MGSVRHVAILIETSRAYGRGIVRGLVRYSGEHGHWRTYFEPRGLNDPPPPWLKSWQGHGIVARIENRRMAQAIADSGLPVVNLRGTIPDLRFPFIGADNDQVARLAAEHLLNRGLQHFAFCGPRRGLHPGYDRRRIRFVGLIEQAGWRCDSLETGSLHQCRNWQRQQDSIADWLASLPRPVGIMTCNDDYGLRVLNAAQRVGVMVPEEAAVLGVDNDPYLCTLAIPPLTSVDINSEETGYRAAALLDEMMSGANPPAQPPETEPRGVVIRRSTDVLAVDDPYVARTVRFIRDNACQGISARDVLKRVPLSRSTIEARVKEVLGRTIHQEIRRVRVDKAKELLITTELPIKQIARLAGLGTVQYLTRVFHAETGYTPATYRRQRGAGKGLA